MLRQRLSILENARQFGGSVKLESRISRTRAVLDHALAIQATPTTEERIGDIVIRDDSEAWLVETERLSTGEWQSFPENALLMPPSVRDEGNAMLDFYAGLKVVNRRQRCDFFKGVVMSRPKEDGQPRAAQRVRESAATGAMRRIRCSSAATRRSAGWPSSIAS